MAEIDYIAQATKASTAMQSALKIGVEKTLLENLRPRINQLISKNLQEMSDDYADSDENEMDETIDVASLMQEVEDEQDDSMDVAEPEEEDGMGMGAEGEESIASMTPESLKQMIKDALQDILGDDANAGEVDATDLDADAPEEDEFKDDIEEDEMYEGFDDIVNEIMADIDDKESPDGDKLQEQVKKLKKSNEDLKKANGIYKKALNESKLSLIQLSYINGLIVESKLSNSQIIKFTELLEKTKTPQEAKNLYEAINESVKSNVPKSTIKSQKIKESYGLNSNTILPNKTQVKQEDSFVTRMKRNAGIR